MSTVAIKMYRLTLTAEAFALALLHSKPLAGRMAARRADNKWDVMITEITYGDLCKQAKPKENLSDTVVRLLKEGAQ